MNMRNKWMALPLLCCLLLTGCQKGEADSAADSSKEETAQTTAAESLSPEEQGDMHITIESVETSLADLKANDYTVPVWVSLDKNAGITYYEWGAIVDKRCTFTADSGAEGLRFSEYFAINPDEYFIWNVWAATDPSTAVGNMILLNVTLPKKAKAGDHFPITYADISVAETPHVWSNTEQDWAVEGTVTWTDGGIVVTE